MKTNLIKRITATAVSFLSAGYAALAQSNLTAQSGQTKTAIESATRVVSGIFGSVVTLCMYVVGVAGAALLVWAFLKKGKGTQGSDDAIMNWGVTLVIVFAAFEILKLIVGA